MLLHNYSGILKWDALLESFQELCDIKVARSFYPVTFTPTLEEMHIFCDASEDAIGYVIYLCSISSDSMVHITSVTSSSRDASSSATLLPGFYAC